MGSLLVSRKNSVANEKIKFTRVKQEDMANNTCCPNTAKNLAKAHSINL